MRKVRGGGGLGGLHFEPELAQQRFHLLGQCDALGERGSARSGVGSDRRLRRPHRLRER